MEWYYIIIACIGGTVITYFLRNWSDKAAAKAEA
jgi:hypothetical protein